MCVSVYFSANAFPIAFKLSIDTYIDNFIETTTKGENPKYYEASNMMWDELLANDNHSWINAFMMPESSHDS